MQLARNCGTTVATAASAAGADLLKAHGADIIGKTTSR
jgi:NADPH:quinone reductase-like Zn-dependent oxidoreductase